MAAEGRSGGGRRALGRVFLVSLAERARAELGEREARGQRLRARRALRRLDELERALERFDLGIPPMPVPWYRRPAAAVAAAVILLAAAGALASAVAVHGPVGVAVGVADIAMLVATLAWFWITVSRQRPQGGGGAPPPNEGSTVRGAGR